MQDPSSKKANRLANETSPYLLQHAYNPVDWLPFGDEAFEKAKRENKPVIVSIGYSACHWCHVMEHESFEDAAVAELMNHNFICVKVDREERSDVDMLYMQALHLMSGQGGWPLNCFVLPDGRPFYGGTYFPKAQWMQILETLAGLYKNDPEKVLDYAGKLTDGIKQAEQIVTTSKAESPLTASLLSQAVARWKQRMDNREGGPAKAPKFPLPSNYSFLLRYATLAKDDQLMEHVNLTLTKMAFGGIYDQVRGGFARYSTDIYWKVPHFEKMLYDNAQLVSLYCEAFNITGNELYRQVAIETLNFVGKEWLHPEGYFYSAYDADSEGEEGKYYVWTKEELESILGEDFDLFSRFFEINRKGYWEKDNYILMRREDYTELLADKEVGRTELLRKIDGCKEKLRQVAEKRVKPGLDDKMVTSWNALMCSAYAQAYLSFGHAEYKETALRSAAFLLERMTAKDGRIFRTYKNGQAKINGFLEDYAFTAGAMIDCYLASQDEKWFQAAENFTRYALEHFSNPESPFLFYTDDSGVALVTRTTETNDNVIPASNSQMAHNLYYLGTCLDNDEWTERANRMTATLSDEIKNYAGGFSHWASLALHYTFPSREIAIVGNNVDEFLRKIYARGQVNAIFAISASGSQQALLQNRHVPGKTMVYVCQHRSCGLPVETAEQALEQLA